MSTSPSTEETYYLEAAVLRCFVDEVKDVVAQEDDPAERVRRLRPAFSRLLADQSWLPGEFLRPDLTGGMGGGIGNYLLYRSSGRDLTLMSLVLPAGGTTPVHDHLAWGLVGVYVGEQDERDYRREDANGEAGTANLIEVEQRHLEPGDFYELLPPDGDIHAVQAVGTVPSVSIHLLGNDIGCTWRHRYEPELHLVHPFRSSYSNAPCAQDAP